MNFSPCKSCAMALSIQITLPVGRRCSFIDDGGNYVEVAPRVVGGGGDSQRHKCYCVGGFCDTWASVRWDADRPRQVQWASQGRRPGRRRRRSRAAGPQPEDANLIGHLPKDLLSPRPLRLPGSPGGRSPRVFVASALYRPCRDPLRIGGRRSAECLVQFPSRVRLVHISRHLGPVQGWILAHPA